MPASSRLRRRDAAARGRVKALSQPSLTTWELGISAGKYMAGAGVIGVAMGLCVLLSYGWSRNAFPDFGGDEWAPQLARIGVFCSVMVMLLMAVPMLDVLAQQPIVRGASSKAAPWRWLVRVLAHAAVGIVFLVILSLVSESWAQALALVSLCFFAMGLYLEVELKWGGVHWPKAWGQRVEVILCVLGSQLLYVMLLITLWVIVDRRFQQAAGMGSWALLVAVILLFALYRTAFLSVYSIGSTELRHVGGAILFVFVALLFAPEILRMAGVANLPHMRLLLERHTACEVVRHLALKEEGVVAECARSPAGATQLPISLDADVVSRVGGQYVLTAPGDLLKATNRGCDYAHSLRLGRVAAPREVRYLRCVDIPRDAVKAVLR